MERRADAKPTARCADCDREWFGRTAAHALAQLNGCIRCGGSLEFFEDPSEPSAPEPLQEVAPHLALGKPRL
ncbi:MAG: hypothetical protein H0V29_05050 [Thermoleophilaceae bacterium]|nr:hypothetical protein [Thermoleophilaceae bacterium]